MPEASKLVLCFEETTGIHDISSVAHANKQIYNITGQRLTEPQQGINIVGNKKVLVY